MFVPTSAGYVASVAWTTVQVHYSQSGVVLSLAAHTRRRYIISTSGETEISGTVIEPKTTNLFPADIFICPVLAVGSSWLLTNPDTRSSIVNNDQIPKVVDDDPTRGWHWHYQTSCHGARRTNKKIRSGNRETNDINLDTATREIREELLGVIHSSTDKLIMH